jgi:hypothetical protein
MNHIVKKALKVTAVAVTLLVLLIAAGVGYTWYMSEYGESTQSIQPPAAPRGGVQNTTRPKIPDTASIGVSVQSITSPVTPGSNASIMVKTNPEANCDVSVVYDKAPAKDSGLVQKKADEYGIVEWTWTVDSNAPLGSWPVEVTCANKKNSAVVKNDLRVVKTLE